jgi:hypothetical protein
LSGKDKQDFKSEGCEEERGSWDSKLIFLLATFAYAVGLENVWLFQYLSQNNMSAWYPCIIHLFTNFRKVSVCLTTSSVALEWK